MKAIDFIKECGSFFVLTVNDNGPAGRPFGAIMEHNDNLYISTADTKNVYVQMKKHSKIQIIALKNGTRSWIRLSGEADECLDVGIKHQMLMECPVLTSHFPTADTPHYSVFKIRVEYTEIY